MVAEPLVGKQQPDKPLLQILVPGSLHLKLGVVNDALEQLGQRWDGLEEWLRGKGILYVPYHGMCLEGKECSRVVMAVDDLQNHLPDQLRPFCSYLRSFGAVMASTFGLLPHDSWEEDLNRMRQEFLAMRRLFGLRETPKLHLLFQHVPEFIRFSEKTKIECLGLFGIDHHPTYLNPDF